MSGKYDNSRYRTLIKYEQKKIKVNTGICGNYNNDDNINLLGQIFENNRNCIAANVGDSDTVSENENSNYNFNNINARIRPSRYNSACRSATRRDEIRTNIYKFNNQNFTDNTTENSYTRISEIYERNQRNKSNNFDRASQTEAILRKYCKNCKRGKN